MDIRDEITKIEANDPTVMKVFVAEYHFLKGDMETAHKVFSELYNDPGLSETMQATVRNYLLVAAKELRKKELENMTFEITFKGFNDKGHFEHVITNDTLVSQTVYVGKLLELFDYSLKRCQQKVRE